MRSFALPLVTAIHEGVVFTNRDKRTLLDKIVVLFASLGILSTAYLVADRYYASAKVILALLKRGQHLVSAMRSNAVAYLPAPEPLTRRRGRPKKYGRKIALRSLFAEQHLFASAPSPVYGERGVVILYRTTELHWRAAGRLVLFVSVRASSRPSRSATRPWSGGGSAPGCAPSAKASRPPSPSSRSPSANVFLNFSRPAPNPISSRNSPPKTSTLTGLRAGA